METRTRPEPGPGELLLHLRCCGLCGTDLFKLRFDTVPPGTVLGHEVVGTVEAVGDGMDSFDIGARVVVPHHLACGTCAYCARGSETLCRSFRENLLEPGGFSESVLVRERAARVAAHKLPDGMGDEVAVFLEPAACVLRGVRRSGVWPRPAQGLDKTCVAVLGAGSMGLLHLLILRSVVPDSPIVLVEPIEERRSLAEKLGADVATPPDERELGQVVSELSGGVGADVVFDTTGGSGALELACGLTREGGTVVLFAHFADGERASLELNQIFKYERRILGTYSGSLSEQQEIFELMTAGSLDPSPLVTHRLPLSRFEEAVALSRQQKALKVLLVPDGTLA